MVLDDTGNLGLGIDDPAHKIHIVRGSVRVDNDDTTPALYTSDRTEFIFNADREQFTDGPYSGLGRYFLRLDQGGPTIEFGFPSDGYFVIKGYKENGAATQFMQFTGAEVDIFTELLLSSRLKLGTSLETNSGNVGITQTVYCLKDDGTTKITLTFEQGILVGYAESTS